jgi:hypothetical protein
MKDYGSGMTRIAWSSLVNSINFCCHCTKSGSRFISMAHMCYWKVLQRITDMLCTTVFCVMPVGLRPWFCKQNLSPVCQMCNGFRWKHDFCYDWIWMIVRKWFHSVFGVPDSLFCAIICWQEQFHWVMYQKLRTPKSDHQLL